MDDWEADFQDDDDTLEFVPCPSCGVDVYEEAEQCPRCGEWIVHSTRVWEGKPWWWVLLGLAGLAAVIWVFAPF